MPDKKILNFIAEAGMLKHVKRSGWSMLGTPYEESVADHSFRCAVIGYVLAKLEKEDPYPVLLMTLFGDMPESRIGDVHKVANLYLNGRAAEKTVYSEQIKGLGKVLYEELDNIKKKYDKQKDKAALIARDADILECLIQAKEYFDLGFSPAKKFFRAGPKHLKTKTAKRLWTAAQKWDSSTWWEELTKFER